MTGQGSTTKRGSVWRVLVAALLLLPLLAQAQSVALSFDDGLDPLKQAEAAAWNAAILAALSDAGLPSILYVAGSRVDSPAGLALVRDWGTAGHAIANHSYSHRNYGSASVDFDFFVTDVEKNETLLRGMPGWTPRLRFPYLKEGETSSKRDRMRAWMSAHGYRSGAVSIDASDWYYSQRYLDWRSRHPDDDPAVFRRAYLDHLWQRASYYDELSRTLFGRSVPHVLLLHTNAINADFLPDVIAMFRGHGWTLIAPEQAYADPVYALQPEVLPAGESLLWSLAKSRGVEGLRYPAEDGDYEQPLLDALGL